MRFSEGIWKTSELRFTEDAWIKIQKYAPQLPNGGEIKMLIYHG